MDKGLDATLAKFMRLSKNANDDIKMLPLLADLKKYIEQDRLRHEKLAKISALKKIAAKTHGGEHKSQDYIDGYNEMRGKILFEVNRLSKGNYEQ